MIDGDLKRRDWTFRCALLGAALACAPAKAQGLVLKCEERIVGTVHPMTMTYEGGSSGTLKVTGSFGEMTLPATREEREGDVDGTEVKATGIRAFGAASVLMPDSAALDACIASRREPGAQPDPDIDALSVLGCSEKLPNGPTPVPINATVEISVIEPPIAHVFLKRAYLEKSSTMGEPITLESVPPPS